MNTDHDRFCSSPEWAAHLATTLVPWGLDGIDHSGHVVELGGGFGASTAWLASRATSLVVVEADGALAAGLAERFPEADVRHRDATDTGLPGGSVDLVVCFTMLHHVSPVAAQDALFAEAARVLRPGGRFAGTDSVARVDLHEFHSGDVYEPVDPAGLPERLRAAGFDDIHVDRGDGAFRFRGTARPTP